MVTYWQSQRYLLKIENEKSSSEWLITSIWTCIIDNIIYMKYSAMPL